MMATLFFLSFAVTLNFRRILQIGEPEFSASLAALKEHSFTAAFPAQVVLTDFGWNHANLDIARQYGRTEFQARLNRGIESHPWYNPLGWKMYQSDSLTRNQRLYVFLDLETCYEENFPNYGWGLTANSDREHGRPYLSSSGGMIRHMKAVCPIIDQVLESPIFDVSHNHSAVLVLFDCGWEGPPQWSCLNRHHNPKLNDHQVSIVSESASSLKGSQRSMLDMGLPPPAIHKVLLSPSQQAAISICKTSDQGFSSTLRPYLFTFVGNFRHPVRQKLLELHNPQTGVVVQHHFGGSWNTSSVGRGVHVNFANLNGHTPL
jgi:hypothetical protein